MSSRRDFITLLGGAAEALAPWQLGDRGAGAAAGDEKAGITFAYYECSWLNAVEGFFAKLTRQRLKRGVFRSIVELQAAINRFLREANEHPKPFTWTADPDKIIAAVRRGHRALGIAT